MSAVGALERAASTALRLERLTTAFPLLACLLLLVFFHAMHAFAHGSPWLFSDEAEYTQLSRAIAETGHAARRGEPHSFVSLYTYVLAPVWWIENTATAYSAAKYLGVALMTSAVFPTYALARMLVPRGWAVFAAVATISIPALAYSRLLITEVLAYPFTAVALFLMVKALATWERWWLVAALSAMLVAPAVRGQLVVLPAAFAIAGLVVLWLSEPARRFRTRWGAFEWTAAALLAVSGIAAAAEIAERFSYKWYIATTLPDRLHDFTVWSTGAFAIGLGLLPVIASLVALYRPDDLTLPAYRAFVGVFVGSAAVFVFYAGVKATWISTQFANVITERNLIYLSPLVFVGTALVLHRPRVALIPLALAAGLVAYLATETPYQLDHFPYSDAPGLAVLAEANRTLSMDDAAIERGLLWIVVVSAVLLAAAAVVRRLERVVRGALVVVAGLVVAWNLVGANAFGVAINDLGNRVRSAVPEPPTWIDEQTGGAPTLFLGQGIADPNPILTTEFWNRAVDHVGSLDETAPGPGPTVTPIPGRIDGAVANDPGVDFVVTHGPGVDVAGDLVLQTGDWRLVRTGGPVRLRSAVTGVYPDGWTGAAASYSRFGRGERGTVSVYVSRTGWGGPDKPGNVTIRVGRLVPAPIETIMNPCAGGTCVSRDPRIVGKPQIRRWVAHARHKKTFRIRVTTPFRVEISVDPTFSPREFGLGEPRQFGVQVAFGFEPRT